jgi:hypothetical protein
MDLYHKLNNDDEFINYFCDLLEGEISSKVGYEVIIDFKKHDMSIFFFIDGSSILQVMPDKDLQYTYAHVPSYEKEIQSALKNIDLVYTRDQKISQIIKKES